MGKFRFIRARNYKDYWIINELAEQSNEEGKDGRFRWCHPSGEHPVLPYIDKGRPAKLVVSRDAVPRIIGFYSYDRDLKRLDVIYVIPNRRGRHVALEMVKDFMHMFPGEEELYVLRPCKAVRKMLNKHYPGRFRAVSAEDGGIHPIEFEEEDLKRTAHESIHAL